MCIRDSPSAAWAAKIFPGQADAEEKLWQAIFDVCRVKEDGDVVAAWKEHVARTTAPVSYTHLYTSERARLKVMKLAKELTPWTGNLNVYVVPYTKPQAVSYTHLDVYKRQVLDTVARTVKQNGQEVALTPREFDLLEQLMRNRGAALYRDCLLYTSSQSRRATSCATPGYIEL